MSANRLVTIHLDNDLIADIVLTPSGWGATIIQEGRNSDLRQIAAVLMSLSEELTI